MRKILPVFLIVLFIPAFLVTFTVIHELGHTVLARFLGDPESVFYLAKFDEQGMCLGCNIYDPSKLSWGANLVVSLGGLFATQIVALTALFLLRLRNSNRLWQRTFSSIALGFAFLDVSVQAIQGLLYDLNHQAWPTNVDLTDVMLLLQVKVVANQFLLKGFLFMLAVIYLSAFVGLYKRDKIMQAN